MLSRLILCGRITMKIGESASTIKSILAGASEYSPASGLTGGFVFNEKFMMEVVEGARDQVSKRLHRLFEDARFEDLTVVALASIDKRIFEGWAVGYAGRTVDAERLYLKYSPTVDINPTGMTAVGILDFVREFCALDTIYVQRAGFGDVRTSTQPGGQRGAASLGRSPQSETIKVSANMPLMSKPVANA